MATQTVPNRFRRCERCGTAYEPYSRRSAFQRFCGASCRTASFRGVQARLDFTPAASEHAQALRGRETKAQRILARLRIGPATTWELQRITGRFSARLQELEERGLRYDRQDFKAAGSEHSVYTMTQEPREE